MRPDERESAEGEADERLYLVDGTAYIFRAFHAIQHLSNSQGTPTNAVFGVTRMLLKLLEEERPARLAVVFDLGGPTFRHERYPAYKAHRPPLPEEMRVQIPLVRRAVEALGLPVVELVGFEADDLIATLAARARAAGLGVVVVSGDKDLLQLVGDGVEVVDPMGGKRYDRSGVQAKLGVAPELVVDLLGLMGDSSDNLPGVEGVGPKTAVKLLEEHGDLERVLGAAPGMKKGKLRERLLAQAEQARLCRELAGLRRDAPLAVELESLRPRPRDAAALAVLDAFLAEMDFSGLRKELTGLRRIDTDHYRCVLDEAALLAVLDSVRRTGACALDLETTSLDPREARIVGLALCPAPGEAAYVPVGHVGPAQLSLARVLELVRPVLDAPGVRLFGQNIKYDMQVLLQQTGWRLKPVWCDAMLASYVLDPGRPSHGLDALSREHLGHEPISFAQVTAGAEPGLGFAGVSLPAATAYAGEDADLTLRLGERLRAEVEEAGLGPLLEELELPLIGVLVDMERAGILLDGERLRLLGQELEGDLGRLEARCHELAGREFNLNSPSQLRVLLFEELGLTPTKKVKSGASTDSSVLEELAPLHPLPAEILAYRSLAKLKSTYVDVLPGLVSPATGRLHTHFNQAVTATGRLSSSEPNLQNIPVRGPIGQKIRAAFVAPAGHRLLSADYNQVELRILAHLAGDPALLEAFRQGEDVHARTAARLFDLPIALVTSELRQRAKAVNFGIVYGQGPYALARQLGISQAEARDIIEGYLGRYPGVAAWIEAAHQAARERGCATTLFGRRRFLPDIQSPNHNARKAAERVAQNTPIQGAAADLIKRAMLAVHREIITRGLGARLLLQVHDELLLEVPEHELDLLSALVREKMEAAAELAVPLSVDVSTGTSWAEAH
jgi:DNA polymerase-1